MALVDPLWVSLQRVEIVVDTCVTLLLALLWSEVAIQVGNLCSAWRILHELIANILTKSNILNILHQLMLLHRRQDILHNASLLLLGWVALNLDDELGLLALLCLNEILLKGWHCLAILQRQ